jgi:iron-regulated transporter 1
VHAIAGPTLRAAKRACKLQQYVAYVDHRRSWEFAVALLLIDLYPDSLRLVAAYGIADNVVRVVLGSRVGSFISRFVPPFCAAASCSHAASCG